MRQTWEKWRGTVLVALVNADIAPAKALDLVVEENGWMREVFADGQLAGSMTLDFLSVA